MMGKQKQTDPKLFYHGVSLNRRIGGDHPLRKIDSMVDFDFIRSKVADLYGKCGNPSVDPAVILRLMFLAFYENVKSERALMSQLPLRLDWLWFCGYDIDSLTPDHSVISKARRRWGQNVFIEFFNNILSQCIEAGLVDGETIHVDSSMIDADASKDSLSCQFRIIGEELYDGLESNAEPVLPKLEKRVSTTDPDARLGRKYGKTTLGFKDHRSVDDKHGIVTATVTTPANINDEKVLSEVIEEHNANTGTKAKTIAADKAYGIGENYKYLHEHGITPCISHKVNNSNCHPDFNHDKFTYDNGRDRYICPTGNLLKRKQFRKDENRVIYQAKRKTCKHCQHFEKCVTSKKSGRQIQRNINQEHIDWADNCLTKCERKRLMGRRKHKAEGSFADAANNHGFKRMRFRGIEKAKIQNLMIAAIQNLRKLMRYAGNKPAAEACNSALSQLLSAVFAFYRRCLILRQISSHIERILIFQRAIGNNSPTQHII
ncbi:MAG: transposase [Planctomycetes bacterium]|nr:transposase [Planctomycetota bacterium]